MNAYDFLNNIPTNKNEENFLSLPLTLFRPTYRDVVSDIDSLWKEIFCQSTFSEELYLPEGFPEIESITSYKELQAIVAAAAINGYTVQIEVGMCSIAKKRNTWILNKLENLLGVKVEFKFDYYGRSDFEEAIEGESPDVIRKLCAQWGFDPQQYLTEEATLAAEHQAVVEVNRCAGQCIANLLFLQSAIKQVQKNKQVSGSVEINAAIKAITEAVTNVQASVTPADTAVVTFNDPADGDLK